ncbi:hypothetical protein [Pseudomonas fluorescens]|uniref:hypothetical protein n=1 Tax=Pseudomonas fluorescens TaxID=294 RepID=UPI001242D203|nr:hypothetical protein [Pseudomonas fluorescens]
MTSVLVLRRRVAVFLDTKGGGFFGLLPVCQLVGCACQIAWQGDGTKVCRTVLFVGAAEGCDLLASDDPEDQDQKIAAFGSSYRGMVALL